MLTWTGDEVGVWERRFNSLYRSQLERFVLRFFSPGPLTALTPLLFPDRDILHPKAVERPSVRLETRPSLPLSPRWSQTTANAGRDLGRQRHIDRGFAKMAIVLVELGQPSLMLTTKIVWAADIR